MYFKNDRLLRAIHKKPLDRTPVWIMRQAGRYLPEYRQLRERAGSFMNLCKSAEFATEATLLPISRYELDAAILFSDILTIPDAFDLGLNFDEKVGPYFARPVQSINDINRLPSLDLNKLSYVYDAIRLIKNTLSGIMPLIGFCGSPFTIAAYVVEGQGKNGFPRLQQLLATEPHALHQLLNILTQAIIDHLNAQSASGIDVAMIFDTWGGLLNTADYQTFSLPYLKKIIKGLKPNYNNNRVPVMIYTKGGSDRLEAMADIDCDVLGIDWQISLSEARQRVGNQMTLQGNLNPATLKESPEVIRHAVKQVLASFGHGSGHIFNLGHGITPDIPPEHVTTMIDAVHEESKQYHVQTTSEVHHE